MKKKLLGLVLAATMLIGATMTAFAGEAAGDTPVTNASASLSGQISYDADAPTLPVINVTVSRLAQDSAIVINPYNLTVNDVSSSVVMGDISFNNNGNTPISLNLEGYVSANGAVKIVTTEPKTQTADNQAYVAVKYVNASGKEMFKTDGKTKVGAVAYPGGSKAVKLATSPVLAVSSNVTGTGYSYQVVMKFTGVAMPSNTKAWASTDKFNVITVYNIKTERSGAGLESKFDTTTTG